MAFGFLTVTGCFFCCHGRCAKSATPVLKEDTFMNSEQKLQNIRFNAKRHLTGPMGPGLMLAAGKQGMESIRQ